MLDNHHIETPDSPDYHLTPERMLRLIYAEGTRNPELRQCTPESLITCIITAAQLGLEPSGPLGMAYLIPRKKKVPPRSFPNAYTNYDVKAPA